MPHVSVVHTKDLGDSRFRDLKVKYQRATISYWDYTQMPTGIYLYIHRYSVGGGMKSWTAGQAGDGYILIEELDRYRPSALKRIRAKVIEHADQIHKMIETPGTTNEDIKALILGEQDQAPADAA